METKERRKLLRGGSCCAPPPGGRKWRATSQVFQDALSLPEGGLALLGCLLCQSFGSISSSQQLVCSLVDEKQEGSGVRGE